MTTEDFFKKHYGKEIVNCFVEGMVMYDLFGNYEETTITMNTPMNYYASFETPEAMFTYIEDFRRVEDTRYGIPFSIQFIPIVDSTMNVILSEKYNTLG